MFLTKGESLIDIDSARGSDPGDPPNQHFTFIFNTFVMMTLFNEINARKIHGQRNVFEGLLRNYVFTGIWVTTFVSQVTQLGLLTGSSMKYSLACSLICVAE